jgi:hypothetical protein
MQWFWQYSGGEVMNRYDVNHRMKDTFGPAQLDMSINGSVFARLDNATGLPSIPGLLDAPTEVIISEISAYSAIRGREQQLYAFYRNDGYVMGNSINPVWKYNPNEPVYYWASNLAFGPLVPHEDLYK